ncbi:MAG: Flp pilus assembly complex ATPase component TadA [Burkholderiales bacterium]|nr:Flp pilus assembly complex ATPase component TadA [Burkholderiales bacterium]
MITWTDTELQRVPLFVGKAQSAKVSDVHISAQSDGCTIKVRLNGKLHVCQTLDFETGRSLTQRIKAHANLNVAETRTPQDGQLSAAPPLHHEVRIATHPSIYGENMVLRLYAKQDLKSVSQLGIGPTTTERLLEGLTGQEGIVLVCGPTGAGKTTTLHALLNYLDPIQQNTMTLEDPVEILLPGAIQTDLAKLPRMNFAQGLRSLLRQDPDILMVGEIRDHETAQLAIEAAMTGHLVLASLHASDVLGAMARLELLGLPLGHLLPHVRNVICQRLILRELHTQVPSSANKNKQIPLMQIWNPLRHSAQARYGWSKLSDLARELNLNPPWQFSDSANEACELGLLQKPDIAEWIWRN